MYNNAIFVDCLDKVPAVKHWAIYLDSTYTTSGYDPGETDTRKKIEYLAYLDKADWEAAIRELLIPPKWKSTQIFKLAEINPIELKFELKLDT